MKIEQFIYQTWFSINKTITDVLKKRISLAVSAAWGILSLEGHSLARCAWYTFAKYRKAPEAYGLNTFLPSHINHRPILLFHGAAGSWNYMGDLATKLAHLGRPVFVINLGSEAPSTAQRERVLNKVKEIRSLYEKTFNVEAPVVDFVAHSMGGNIALASAFTPECSTLDSKTAELHFTTTPQIDSAIGKIVTLALPSNQQEVDWMTQANRKGSLFNITAKYDALMGHKCGAVEGQQLKEVNAGHIGIVFHKQLARLVHETLLQPEKTESLASVNPNLGSFFTSVFRRIYLHN